MSFLVSALQMNITTITITFNNVTEMGNNISLDPLIGRALDCVQYITLNFGGELVGRHLTYVYYLQRNLDSLVAVLESLGTLRDQLNRRITIKKGYGMQMNEKVQLWMKRVESQIARGGQLETESDRHVDSLCLTGICSRHYRSTSVFGEQVERCLQELTTLKTEGDEFTDDDLVVIAAAELDRGAKMSCDSVGLEAKLAEVFNFLNQENVGIVGVYGQGGVGKTNLLREINNHYVSRSENFLVAWIDVHKHVNLEAIQQVIGEKIGLPNELKGSSIEVKSSYISNTLQQKRIILLLDDIRMAINLSKIGIPPSNSLNDSKVVFTTRPEHVCIEMEPEPSWITSIETLGDERAWQLFVKRVGERTIYSHPQILQLARRVAQKCGGLPLALSMIGQAMSCKREPKLWEHVLKTFEIPSLQPSTSHQDAQGDSMTRLFSVLRYSYDSLPNETYKSCFLSCALFPESSLIRKDHAVTWWTFEDSSIHYNDDMPYYEAYHILNDLTCSYLLEDEKDYVKMHDVVRSMALWIAKEDTLVMSGMELDEAPSVGMWEDKKRVSLTGSNIMELTQVPECPHLSTLFLSRNVQLNMICSGFFESMGMLTVLNLSHTGIKELPESISGLVSLKYLNLSGTKIIELPVELIGLEALMFLDVGYVGNLGIRRKYQIFHHLTSLQYLGMMCGYYYYEADEGGRGNVGRDDEILLEELQVLKNLKVLEISLRSFSGLRELFNNPNLLKKTKFLQLLNFTSPDYINISLLAQSKHLGTVSILGCDFRELTSSHESTDAISEGSTSSVLTQMISFNGITEFVIARCNYLEEITCVVSMPNLRKLIVSECMKLREIVSREKIERGGEVHPIFSSLAILKLEDLPMLTNIYASKTLSLPFLYDLTVVRCPQLKELPLDPSYDVLRCSQIKLKAKQEWWDAIEWEDDAAKTALLPRFNLNHAR